MRFSREGRWGQGSYFAEYASYSDLYSFTCSNGKRQMFLARVLTGDSADTPPNPTLRLPPEKKGERKRYDTVTGISGSTRIYVTFNNDKAYPSYLITYDREPPAPQGLLGRLRNVFVNN